MLREKISELLTEKPWLFVSDRILANINDLEVAYNLPALILKVSGYSVQGTSMNPRLPLNAPHLDKEWVEFEKSCGAFMLGFWRDDDLLAYALARQLWSREYGDKEARHLPFYGSPTVEGGYYWHDITDVSASNIIAFMAGNPVLGLCVYRKGK